MADRAKRLSKEAAREVISQIFWSYWPYWGAPIVSAALVYAEGHSLSIVFMSGLAAFALVALGLNNFWQWMSSQSPAGKVDFIAPAVAIKNDDSEPPKLQGIKLGAVLRSTALFPMEVRLDSMETQIADRVPTQTFYVRSVMLAQGIAGTFHNALIDMAGLNGPNKTVYGRINARVTYGRPGRLRYPAEHNWYIAIKFDKDGNLASVEPSLTEFKQEP